MPLSKVGVFGETFSKTMVYYVLCIFVVYTEILAIVSAIRVQIGYILTKS